MNKPQLQTMLREKGISFNEDATNKQLERLLEITEEITTPEPIQETAPEPIQKTIQKTIPTSKPKLNNQTKPTSQPTENPIFKINNEEIKSVDVVMKNTSGEEVDPKDYFFKGVVLPSFEKTCGKPVDREDLLQVFNKVFKPEDNILFYKQLDKEVYLIIVPLKYSKEIGEDQSSIVGDFQKHAISFLNEGQVNLDSLRKKLEMIKNFVSYTDR